MLRRVASVRTAILIAWGILLTCPAYPATQVQIDDAWKKGVWWLFMNQSGDGFWKGKEGSQIAATALAIEALNNAPLKTYPFYKGITWLSNVRASSTDSLARQTVALIRGGVSPSLNLERLSALRNVRGGWGAYDQFDTSFPDTPIALTAWRVGAYPALIALQTISCAVLPSQLPDGSWSYMRPASGPQPTVMATGSVLPTALTLSELKATTAADSQTCILPFGPTSTLSITTALNNGKAWLLTKRNPNNGVGDGGVSTIVETAVAYKALKALGETATTLGPIEDFLLGQQNTANGSWGSDAFLTALVLSVLPAPTGTVLIDTDGDGVPDSVEALMGKNPNVRDAGFLAQGGGNTQAGAAISTPLSTQLFRGRPASITLAAASGPAPLTWKLMSGVLPPGLTLNTSSGLISGSPSTVGTWAFTYTVTDAASAMAATNGEIKVVLHPSEIVTIINSILLDD